ncbi:hypothetical protein [Streptomyces sp. NPDC088254]|uniref:hypothetical protein n=1 Tax=Streptomyces sp. NPDC088254 TaxID=3365847 RepID=UPI0037F7E123
MPVDMATCVREHTERYAAAHGGQHPLTECMPWAEAIVSWLEALPGDDNPHGAPPMWHGPNRFGPRVISPDELTLVIAEGMRLDMALRALPIGDLPLFGVQAVARDWLRWDIVPGTAQWPAPDGTPYVEQWKALFTADAERTKEAALSAYWAIEELDKHWHDIQMSTAWFHRLHTYKIVYGRLADVAPLLGLTMPIQVREPGDYISVPGLLVEQAA